jgi:hypothetical protein
MNSQRTCFQSSPNLSWSQGKKVDFGLQNLSVLNSKQQKSFIKENN